MMERGINERPVSVLTKTTKPQVFVETKTVAKSSVFSLGNSLSPRCVVFWMGLISLFTLLNFALLLVLVFQG